MIVTLKRPLVIAVLLLCIMGGPLFSQESNDEEIPPPPQTVRHILGDQALAFSLGGFLPLFFLRTADGAVEATNLYIGGKGSIEYLTYLSSSFIFSVELCFALAFSPNFNIYWSLPVLAEINYVIYAGSTQFFLTMGLGVNFQSFIGFSCMDMIARPEVSFYFPIDPALDLGFTVAYWFVPQFASPEQEAEKPGQTRLGNFMDFSVSLIYHF